MQSFLFIGIFFLRFSLAIALSFSLSFQRQLAVGWLFIFSLLLFFNNNKSEYKFCSLF